MRWSSVNWVTEGWKNSCIIICKFLSCFLTLFLSLPPTFFSSYFLSLLLSPYLLLYNSHTFSPSFSLSLQLSHTPIFSLFYFLPISYFIILLLSQPLSLSLLLSHIPAFSSKSPLLLFSFCIYSIPNTNIMYLQTALCFAAPNISFADYFVKDMKLVCHLTRV